VPSCRGPSLTAPCVAAASLAYRPADRALTNGSICWPFMAVYW
jgi:hypothetical protein